MGRSHAEASPASSRNTSGERRATAPGSAAGSNASARVPPRHSPVSASARIASRAAAFSALLRPAAPQCSRISASVTSVRARRAPKALIPSGGDSTRSRQKLLTSAGGLPGFRSSDEPFGEGESPPPAPASAASRPGESRRVPGECRPAGGDAAPSPPSTSIASGVCASRSLRSRSRFCARSASMTSARSALRAFSVASFSRCCLWAMACCLS